MVGRIPLAAMVVAGLMASSCSNDEAAAPSSSKPDASATTTTAAAAPATAWEAVLDRVSDPIDLQTAIDAFSLAFGPIAGASASDLEPGFSGSGTGPLRWLLGHWTELSADQQSQVDGILAAWEVEPPLATGLRSPAPVAQVAQVAPLQSIVDDMVVNLEALLGRSLGFSITVKVVSQAAVGDSWAIAVPHDAGGDFIGPATSCTISFGPKAATFTGTDLVALAAHEVFHCFEFTLGTLDKVAVRPAWIMEGMAEWAGAVIAGDSPGGWWEDWLEDHAYRSLFARTYDAIGFYAHVNDNGVDMWSRVDQAIIASDNGSESAYAVLIDSSGTEMVDSWSAGYFRDPANAPLWDQNGPGITLDAPTIKEHLLHDEETFGLAAEPYAILAADLDLAAAVVTFESPGPGMVLLADGSTQRLADLHGQALCTTGSCVCPEGTPMAGTIFTDISPGVVSIGATGHTSGSEVTVVGWSLDRFCNGERCHVGTWQSRWWHVPRIIAGGFDAPLVITKDGEGYIDWSQATDLFGIVQGGTDAGAEILPLKLVLSGASHFFVETKGAGAQVTSTAGSMGITPYIDLGNGWFETGSGAGYLGFGSIGGEATFACAGNTLYLNGAIQFVRVSTDAEIPAAAAALTPTPVEGSGGPVPTGSGEPPDTDPCTLLTLAEVQTLAPGAVQPEGPDDSGTTFLTQCSFGLAVAVQIYGPLAATFFTDGAEALGSKVVDIPGIGDWALAQINQPDGQFITDENVVLVVAGTATGTVALVPFVDVFEGTTEYAALLALLQLAIGRL